MTKMKSQHKIQVGDGRIQTDWGSWKGPKMETERCGCERDGRGIRVLQKLGVENDVEVQLAGIRDWSRWNSRS